MYKEKNHSAKSVGTTGGYGKRKQHTTTIKNLEKLSVVNMMKINFSIL